MPQAIKTAVKTDRLFADALVRADSFDPATRTIEVCWATTAPVRRSGWEGPFQEVLSMDPKHIRLGRMQTGAMSLLDTHDSWEMDKRLGVVIGDSLRFEKDKAYCRVQISQTGKGADLLTDLNDGMPFPVSVGYRVYEYTEVDSPAAEIPVRTATDWEPLEISAVPIPADPSALSRNLLEEHKMNAIVKTTPDEGELSRAELLRREQIRNIGKRLAGTDEAFIQRHVDSGTTVDAFRAALIEHHAERQERTPTFPVFETRGGRDERDTMRRLAANGIMHRNGLTPKLEEGAQEFRNMTVGDVARDVLMRTGQNFRGSNAEVIQRSLHSTSDFPIILGEVTRQTMMDAYNLEQETNTYQLIATRNVMVDLRDVKVLELGDGPELELITEKGEYKRGTVRESKESFGIQHWGKAIGLTEAMLINDQLGQFSRLIQNWARVAARLEGNIVWNVINTNMVLTSDNKALFHADHGNLAGTGTTLDKSNLIAGRKAFRKMKNIDGQQISLKPDYVFVGTDLEVDAQVLLQSTTNPVTPADVVPQALKSIVPVYESRIDNVSSKAWYLFASPAQTLGRGLQYSVLSGYETPRMKDRWGFDYDGVEYRLDHYFGAGLTDFRFAYKNPGL